MKPSTLAAFLIVLAPLTLAAQAPTQQPQQQPAGSMAMEHAKPPLAPSRFLNVTFQGHTTTLTVEDLLNMPQVTVHVHNGHSNKDETYSGPLVADVLARGGFVASAKTHSLILHSSVVATGTDNYYVLYSAAELEPGFTSGQAIVAVMRNGLPDAGGGAIQIVDPLDLKPARWVHALMGLNVMSLDPLK